MEEMDERKCMYCGKCVNGWGLGGMLEMCEVLDVLEGMGKGEEVIGIGGGWVLGELKGRMEEV